MINYLDSKSNEFRALDSRNKNAIVNKIITLVPYDIESVDPEVVVQCLDDSNVLTEELVNEISQLVAKLSQKAIISDSMTLIDYLDKKSVNFKELKLEVKKEVAKKIVVAISQFGEIATGVSQLINKGHELSDPQIIIECLEDTDPSVTPDLIAEIADLINSFSKKTIISDNEALIKYLNRKSTAFKALESNVKEDIADRVIAEMYADNPIYWITPTIQSALQVTLLKGLVHLLEKVEPKKRNSKELFPSALQMLLDISTKDLGSIYKRIKKIQDPTSKHYVDDEKERNRLIQLKIKPFVNNLIQIFFEDDKTTLKNHLPVIDELKPHLEKMIRENACKLILPMIETSTSWIDAKEKNRDCLDQIFGNEHAAEACRLVGSLTSQAIPYALQEYHKTMASGVSKKLDYLFTSKSGKKPSRKELRRLRKMVGYTLLSLSKNKTPSMNGLLKFAENFAESALLRIFADLAKCLDALDDEYKNDPDGSILVQGTQLLLKETKEHLSLISEFKAEKKQYDPDKISHDELQKKFKDKGHLHRALDSEQKHNQFFVNLSKRFFNIVGVSNVINLPIPEFLKNSVWDHFETGLMPKLLITLFAQMKDPHTLNLILISIFQQINETAGNLDVSIPDDQIRKYKDAPQDELEKISGELIKALVQMNPTFITNWALNQKKVKDLAGQAMGQPLRRVLEERSMVKIIDELIISILPTLHPGEWDATGKYVCLKEKDKKIIEIQPDFSHILPRTKKAKQDRERHIQKNCQDAEELVVKEIAHAIENQTQYIFLGFFRKIWRNFRQFIDNIIDKVFGKYAPNIKKASNNFFNFLGRYFIKPILYITAIPVLLVVRRLLRFYFVHQSSRRVGDINHKINENVIFRVVDEIIKLLNEAKNSHDQKQTNPDESYDSFDESDDDLSSFSA